jgi:hypothetical protein
MPDSPWDFEDVEELVGILLSPVGAEVAEALKLPETRTLLCSPNGCQTFFELVKYMKKQKKSEPELGVMEASDDAKAVVSILSKTNSSTVNCAF